MNLKLLTCSPVLSTSYVIFFFLKMMHAGTASVCWEVPASTCLTGKVFQRSVFGIADQGSGL